MRKSIFIVAAERSGDDLGAGLIAQLRERDPSISIQGIGGSAMAARGVESDLDISPLSILGFTEAIKAYPIVMDRVRQAVEIIMEKPHDAIVLIDSWGFMLRVAWGLRKARFEGQIIKYVAPQVFAMREGRAKVLANAVDHLMTIHSFDAPYFEQHGLPVTYVGNPMFDTDYTGGDGQALRARLKIPDEAIVIAVLFGSRLSEIQRLAKPFADAVEIIKSSRPDIHLIAPLSETIATDVRAAAAEDMRLQDVIFLPEETKFDVFAASDIALACSGTVTTQLACAGVPTVVAYKLSGLTYFFAKRLYKPDYVSLVNIAADEALMPEYIQGDCRGDKLASAILSFVDDQDLRKTRSEALVTQTDEMKGEGGLASARAAETVLSLISD